MDKMEARQVTQDVITVLKEKFPKWSFGYGGANFLDTTLTMKVEISLPNAEGKAEDKKIVDFKKYATTFGFTPEDLNREFMWKGEVHRICGLVINRRAYPILGIRLVDNKKFCFRAGDVLEKLKK